MTASGELTVWRIHLDQRCWDALPCVLNEQERAQAEKFIQPQAAIRFRRCRNVLRHLLALHTGHAAERLALRCGPFGKPELPDAPPHFNVSHSDGWALVAVGGQPLGIDLEPCRRDSLDLEAIAALACHPGELSALAVIGDTVERGQVLLTLWTRKEAYVKATGMGLQLDLRQIRLAGEDGRDVCDTNPGSGGGYRVYPVNAPPGFIASLCLAGPLPTVRYRDASSALQAVAGADEAKAESQHCRVDQVAGL